MGIPVMSETNIHSPSVGQAPRASSKEDDVPLTELIRRKENLEAELSALGSVLDSHGVTMVTGLTTFDGFPRADIDVAQIRTTRARIIHLRNDHKALMSRIESGLHAHFAAQEATPTSEPPTPAPSNTTPASSQASSNHTNGTASAGPAFAAVNSVTTNSPAAEAGLMAGDKIQRFGDATWFNHEKLARVAQIVGRSDGRAIEVTLLRRRADGDGEEQLVMRLTPRTGWGGRGSLGCHLLPL